MDRLIAFLKSRHYRFITPTPLTHQRVNARPENAIACDLQGVFGWNRPFETGLLPADVFAALKAEGVVAPHLGRWRSMVRASTVGDDLFLHTAFPTIEPDAVFFGPDTYRFCRLIRHTLQGRSTPAARAVDIGSGSGAGAATVARVLCCKEMVCADINARALTFSQPNLDGCGLTGVRHVLSDLFVSLDGSFDVIVSNPPYLNDPSERAYRHGGGALGSALSVRIAVESVARLAPGGTLILYTGSPIVGGRDVFRDEITACLRDAPVRLSYEEIDPDVFGEELELPNYQGVDRIAVVALVATKIGNL